MDAKVKIADIAKLAGVSAATVSRVFNHQNQVKEETLSRVFEAMRQLGVDPKLHVNATQTNGIILLHVPSLSNPFYSEVIKGASVSAAGHHQYFLVDQHPMSASHVRHLAALAKASTVAGIITLDYMEIPVLEELSATAPLVQCCEYNPASNLSYVSIDNMAATLNVMEYLFSLGRRKIALINGPGSFMYARERQDGYLASLAARNITVPANWIIQLSDVQFDMAYTAACQLLDNELQPNAVFCVSDVFAAAVLKAARRYGLSVPEDLVVTGFDNLDIASMSSPTITTVSQPRFQLGYTACEFLTELIADPSQGPKSLLLSTELIIRESTTNGANFI